LPGVDDGARNKAETRRMLELAYDEGITRIMATPHFDGDMGRDVFNQWNEAYKVTCRIARKIDPKFKIYSGAEIYYDSRIPELLKKGYPITLNKTRYVLVEFPIDTDMTYLSDALFNLQVAGYYPIVAHIERYQALQNEKNVKELVNRGLRLQVNTSTIVGKSGTKLKNYTLNLIQKGYIDIIGTDAHGAKFRRPQAIEAIEIIDKKVGQKRRELLCRRHFHEIVRGEY
jgi:protein-tyrosine phosphatase